MSSTARLFAAVATLTLTAACATTSVRTKDLVGDWDSASCEASGGGSYIQRHFHLTEEAWTLNLDAFGDADCKTKLFSARVGGPYTLERDSEKVAGATEATFGFRDQVMTPHVQGLATAFANAKCGTGTWTVGQEQATATTGCLFSAPPPRAARTTTS